MNTHCIVVPDLFSGGSQLSHTLGEATSASLPNRQLARCILYDFHVALLGSIESYS